MNSPNGLINGRVVVFGILDRRSSAIRMSSFMHDPFRSREISGGSGCQLAEWMAWWRDTKCQNGTEGAKIA